MSHRRVHSQGSNIPFSWEDKPGISKVTQQEYPTEVGVLALNLPPEDSGGSPEPKVQHSHEMKIPLPPCPILRAPSRSTSSKGLRWQAEPDPFLLAYKECTKSVSTLNNSNNNSGKLLSENHKKGFGLIGSRVRKSRFNMFSCKSSCDVRDDNFVKLSQIPPLPRDSNRSSR